MRGWLIDTNVVSELRQARPSQWVRAFVAGRSGDVLFSSDVTFAEIRFGIERIADPARRADLVQWLDRTLRPLLAGRVLSVTESSRRFEFQRRTVSSRAQRGIYAYGSLAPSLRSG